MTWPTSTITTTNTDAGTDSPATARADLLAALQALSLIIGNGEPITLAGAQTIAGAKTFSVPPNGIAGSLLAVQVFTAGGTYTRTAGARFGIMDMIGGGGGSGGTYATSGSQNAMSSVGGMGAYIRALIASLPATAGVTIGAGGAAGAPSSNGSNGGDSIFGTSSDAWYVRAPGGLGGGYGAPVSSFPAVVLPTSTQYVNPTSLGSSVTKLGGPAGTYNPPGANGILLALGVFSAGNPERSSLMGRGNGAYSSLNAASSSAGWGIAGSAGAMVLYEFS